MLVTLSEVLNDAQKRKYGVGMFNAVTLEMARAIIDAAEETMSPVIFGTAEALLPAAGLEDLTYFLMPMAKKAKVPVVLHFDHGKTEPAIYEALKLGFTSVMYDCSTDTYDNNKRRVAALTKIAHNFGASVEGELGHVGANSADDPESLGAGDHSIYTDPQQAKDYADETGVDALAVAIGNAHGIYTTTPKLDLGVLDDIAAKVACPLVLHGGSGLSDDDFRACIKGGICKINIFTDINNISPRYIMDHYTENLGYSKVEADITAAIKAEVIKKMELFSSVGKA